MPIAIYTYSDPYHLPDESYWEEIKSCPYFCASQTLVNGLKALYTNDFQQGRVTTVYNLIEGVFPGWESSDTMIKQHAVLDQIMTRGVDETLESKMQQNLLAAFVFNREEVFQSIRVLCELHVKPDEIVLEKLTTEQRLVLKAYQAIMNSKDFLIKGPNSETEIDDVLNQVMRKANADCNLQSVCKDSIVIHGIHQFTPIMLHGIELLSRYKKVILLFNYQKQYSETYQTWIDIYTAFDSQIHFSQTAEFHPELKFPQSYQSNLLADSLGRMINGNMHGITRQDTSEILEFDNMTEFASYVADLYTMAAKSDVKNPLYAMREQIYSADSSVNNILRMYFPEQFGERQFLNYPLGHFFVAIANMWDAQQNKICIDNQSDILVCLGAGILPEEVPGELMTIYGKTSALFDGCADIYEMVARLKRLQRIRRTQTDSVEVSQMAHISYYQAASKEIEKLKKALEELDELSKYFYEDFEDTAHNFRAFYKKLRAYIQEQNVDAEKLGDEYADILRRVLERLQEVENIDASASFECLKATMSIYLAQETKPGKGANWIVRDFEQIDGDILRSFNHADAVTYHFACLTDEDMNAIKRREFPWPLDAGFFEVAQEPVDWKYQVFVKSRREYKNFKKYALLYGLEFNRTGFKLSYVKRDGERDQTLYSLLKILGFKVVPYQVKRVGKQDHRRSEIQISSRGNSAFTEFDYCRYRICKYRFLSESLLEGDTIYKDTFLLGKYLEVLLENKVQTDLAGTTVSEVILVSKLNDAFDEIKRYFPFVRNVNRVDMVNNIRNRLTSNKNKTIPRITPDRLRYMKIRELFIHSSLSDFRTRRNNVLADKLSSVEIDTICEKLSAEQLTGMQYSPEVDVWCQYCSNRELCTACYSQGVLKEE